mmetsp:Transcript_763/g.2075  ORF Transcript_763/g.2075 Transcript_763/m.2075 type:complete len:272 (-) Transcript_763:273-1088(-)
MPMDILVLLAALRLRPLDLVGAHRHLPLAEEDREVVPAAVQRVLLPQLNHVVRKEEHDGEWPTFELRRGDVIHYRVEAQDPLVVFEELLHVCVDVPSAEHHLSVYLLVGSGLHRRMGLHSLARLLEGIRLLGLGRPLRAAGPLIELPCERVTVCDEDATAIDLEGGAHLDVLRLEVAPPGGREPMPADELALWDSAVVLLGLDDLAGVILQVVIDRDLSNTEVFQVRLNDRLLEIAAEAEHMAIKGIPSRKVLELDVRTGILEDGPRLAIR